MSNLFINIPLDIAACNKLNNSDKLAYGLITAMTIKNESCWITNYYAASCLSMGASTFSGSVSSLSGRNLINVGTNHCGTRLLSINRNTLSIYQGGSQNLGGGNLKREAGSSNPVPYNSSYKRIYEIKDFNSKKEKPVYNENPTRTSLNYELEQAQSDLKRRADMEKTYEIQRKRAEEEWASKVKST